jgi:hypothetical protein
MMNKHAIEFAVMLVVVLGAGCNAAGGEAQEAPEAPEALQRREGIVQSMLADHRANGSGLVAVPFPNPTDPVHQEIQKALTSDGKTRDEFGIVCEYFGAYLVKVCGFADHRYSYFYFPTNHQVTEAAEEIGFARYGGDMHATASNAIRLVQHLLAVDGYKKYVVNDWRDIPHSRHSRRNPTLPFGDFLQSKGIIVHPPVMVTQNEDADESARIGYSECSVFAYSPLGGRLLRYEIMCKQGRIVTFRKAVLGEGIGDAWLLM